MNRLIRFLKDWTLPMGMTCGVLGFLAFHYIRLLDPIKPAAQQTAEFLMPTVLFIMLFATFCKVNSSTHPLQRDILLPVVPLPMFWLTRLSRVLRSTSFRWNGAMTRRCRSRRWLDYCLTIII